MKRKVRTEPLVALVKTCVVYARVSSKDQEQGGFSIPAQLRLLRSYAAQKSLTILDEFVDVETAKQSGREGFGRMIQFLKQNPTCRVAAAEKTDRMYRNLRDWVTVDELALELHFVTESVVLSPEARSSEKFMHGIKVLMAKNYVDNLSEETRKGMLEKARQGYWPSYAPLGYLNVDGPDGKRTIEPDPTLAPAIVRLFERYATGNHSLKQLGPLVRADGLRYRKSGDLVPTSTVHKILRNRIYTGDFDFDGVTYHSQGKYQGIIPRELWARVQDVLDGRGSKNTHRVKDQFAFSGLLSCGHCGCAMVGERKKGRYVYYHCTFYKGKCPEPYTREEVLEKQFGELLRNIRIPTDVIGLVTQALRESHHDEKRFHEAVVAKLQAEHKRIQNRIDTMYLDRLDGRIDADFFDRNAAAFRDDQTQILTEIHDHQTANQSYIEEGIKLLDLAGQAHELFENQPAGEKRKLLLDFVLSNCAWKEGTLTAEYRQPFDLIADAGRTAARTAVDAGAITHQNENWLLR